MKFKNLNISNFKCFDQFNWEMSPGLNLVYGPNESGKTSLYQALVLSLFGPMGKKHFQDLDRTDFNPLGSDKQPFLELTFQVYGRRFIVRRDFADNRVLISEEINDKSDFEKFQITKAREFIKEQLGGIEEEIFTRYASINHVELARLDAATYRKENEDMGDSLLKLVESRRGSGLIDVRKKIEKELRENRKETEKHEADLERIQSICRETKTLEEQLDELNRDIWKKTEEYNAKKTRLTDLEIVLNAMSERRDKSKEIADLEKQIKNHEDEHRRLIRTKDEKDKLEAKLENFPAYLKQHREDISRQMAEVSRNIDQLEGQKKTVINQLEQRKQELLKITKSFESEFGTIKEGLDDVRQFKEKDNQIKLIDGKIREIQIRIESALKQIESGKKKQNQFFKLSIGAGILAVIVLIISFFIPIKFILKMIMSFPLFAFAVMFYIQSRRAVPQDALDDLAKHNDAVRKQEAEKANLQMFLTQLSNRLGLSSRDDVDKRYEEFRDTEAKVNQIERFVQELEENLSGIDQNLQDNQGVISNILKETGYQTQYDVLDAIQQMDVVQHSVGDYSTMFTTGNVTERISELSNEITKKTMLLNELRKNFNEKFLGKPLDEDEYILRQKEFGILQDDILKLEKEKASLSGQIKVKEDQVGEGYEIMEERLERMKDSLLSHKKKKQELEYLDVLVAEIEKDYKSEFLPELEKRALALFGKFAGTSDKTFTLRDWPSITISSTELSGFSERHLSQGTRDQLYFALRIAWTDILTPENLKLPMIWDDPLVYWDEERALGACDIAKILVDSGHQIIVFTHRHELVDLFKQHFDNSQINILNLSKNLSKTQNALDELKINDQSL